MKDIFYALADHLQSEIRPSELFTLHASAERSNFVRFNQGKVRQPGSVVQYTMTLRLIEGGRHSKISMSLCGDVATDKRRLVKSLSDLREQLPLLPVDPHLLINTTVQSSEVSEDNELPDSTQMVDSILRAGKGTDLVGILAAGSIYSGFANSLGQRNWFATHNFNLDWSLVCSKDKAVKSSYAGRSWDEVEFANKMNDARSQLEVLRKPSITLDPGEYRVYMTPVALGEILGLLGWGAFSVRAQQNKTSSLLKLVAEEEQLSEQVSLREHVGGGAAPSFQADGFLRPSSVSLIEKGRASGALISPRSAKEFSLQTNGSSLSESPDSLEMEAGSLSQKNIIEQLDTGVYIGNLWYLNYSDRMGCRMTGMTRFATFWVENGQVVAPINVMRFDDTVYRMLGKNLEGLTQERSFLLSASSYFQRSTASARLPGALINDFRFTL